MQSSVLERESAPPFVAHNVNSLSHPLPKTNALSAGKEAILFERYAEKHDAVARERLVANYYRLARYLAAKFAGRNEPLEDLFQVACVGLVKCVDKFDPSRGIKFVTYATPSIVGELKRYFRDKAWGLKVPRKTQELNIGAANAREVLIGRLGRQPTIAEVAHEIGATVEATLEAIEVSAAYSPASLDSAARDGHNLEETIGFEDPQIAAVVENDDLVSAFSSLDARKQNIVNLYYFLDMTELQIARKLSISQMHVSRLKLRALEIMNEHIRAERERVED
jgi:RNA polymerase sigma-B factor